MSDKDGQQHDAAYYEEMAKQGLIAQLPEPEQEEPSPLDVPYKADLNLGWVNEYTNLMTQLTGSPPEFNQLAGITTAATAIQRKAVLRMSFGDIYPNIYGCIIAPSSVYHKSSALNKVNHVLFRAFMSDLLLPDTFISEGLLSALDRQPEGLIVRDEIGTLLSSHKQKYNAHLKQDLTRLYDCQAWNKVLSNDSKTIPRPYLNILGATTPARFYDAVEPKDWRDGFIVRWLFVLPEGEPDFDSMTGMYEVAHDQRIGDLAMQIANLSKRDHTEFVFADGAHELWDTWQRAEAKKAYYYDSDIAAPLVMRYSTYALKFALILSAINNSWGRIEKSTMQTAIDLSSNYKRYVYKLMSEKSKHSVNGGKLQKVLQLVVKHFPQTEGKGVATSKIQQYANMTKGELHPVLEELVEKGALTEETVGNGFRYIPNVEKLAVRT